MCNAGSHYKMYVRYIEGVRFVLYLFVCCLFVFFGSVSLLFFVISKTYHLTALPSTYKPKKSPSSTEILSLTGTMYVISLVNATKYTQNTTYISMKISRMYYYNELNA